MSGSEAIGDIAQGTLLGRASEPAHGEGPVPPGHTDEAACLNCGAALVGPHCHGCGQAAHVHKTLGAFFHDLLHGVFHFEGKIWRTVPLLVWKPGKLTREYIDGRRATYVSPIALFLFCVFLMFAAINQFGGSLDQIASVNVDGKQIKGIAANERELERLQRKRAALIQKGLPTAAIDTGVKQRTEGLAKLRDLQGALNTPTTEANGKPRIYSDVPAINRMLTAFRDNPGLGLYKMQANAYKFSWALIPISVPFVWLLFPFSRRFRLYDHTVFVTYSLCFMTLLTVVATLAAALGAPAIAGLAMLVPPWHIFRQLRGTYGVGKFGALWRTVMLMIVALAALILFALLVLAESGS